MRVQVLPLERFSHRKLIEGLAPIVIQGLASAGHHDGGQLRQDDQRQCNRDRSADAGSDLCEGHQMQSIGGRQARDVAGAALAAVAGVHDRRFDRVHAQQPLWRPS